jgi:predicted lipid-binding transport protein (Tim44 family)
VKRTGGPIGPPRVRISRQGSMSDGFAYLDIIFFAMVAAFIAFRLRNVLGRRTGHERRRTDRVGRPTPVRSNDTVVPMPERQPSAQGPAEEPAAADLADGPLKAGLTQVRLADPSFDPEGFAQGARSAFAMIVEAFAKGERAALRPLLADGVYGEFAQAIDEREQRKHVLTTELVALRTAEITAASVRGTRARVTVRFVSDQINVTRDEQGEVVDGDPKRIAEVADLWTFERDTRSRDPNWELVETGIAT